MQKPLSADRERYAFLLRKLHSLSGVVPVGVFLIEHLWTNATALRGRGAFDRAVGDLQRIPFLPVVEVLGIFLPLAFHAFYGVVLAFGGRANALRYPYSRNWLYVAQRVTGLVAFAFIVFHLWEYRVQKWLFGMSHEAFYGALTEHLSSTWKGIPVLALVYVAGVAASVFHFANGLWGFCVSWGVLITRPAQRRGAMAFGALGVVLFLMGFQTVLHFATGGAPLLPRDEGRPLATDAPCPPGAPAPIKLSP